ncbi:Cyclin M transmembrane protein [Gracilaria domingensis]|nr:Cyclin M transmembrane protein [Gracilaria domingensis]
MFSLHYLLRVASDGGANIHSGEEVSPLHGLPAPFLVVLAFACLFLAACVAGLTLGLMSLDTTGLDIVMQSNNAKQAAAARAIKPIREQGNLLLVTLLFANTIATELLPLVLEALVPGGVFSLVVSVVSIMLFGEIIPQAICSRHPLIIGSYMIGFVKFLRTLLYPVSFPIAWVLDAFLGEELGTIYNREELKGLIDVHASNAVLTQDETTILKGALEFSVKNVSQILTPAKNVFMLDIDSRLDRETMLRILRSGHSRVPLYEHTKHNIVCLLLVKQIILVNPDDNLPIRSLISTKQRNHKVRVAPALECSADVLIADLLNEFQKGRSHMAIVYNDIHGEHDEREFAGIVSIEDIIEEILQGLELLELPGAKLLDAEEIIDETDTYIDNTNRAKVLVRDAKGKLVRTTTISAHTMVLPRNPGLGVKFKEVDVKALRQPLKDAGEKYSRDWKKPKPKHAGSSVSQPLLMEDGTDLEKGLTSPQLASSSRPAPSEVTPLVVGDVMEEIGCSPHIQYAILPNESSLSILGEDDNVVPEDIVRRTTSLPVGSVAPDSSVLPVKLVRDRDEKKPMQVRPLPKDASDARTLRIPPRGRPSTSAAGASPSSSERSYGSIRPGEEKEDHSTD